MKHRTFCQLVDDIKYSELLIRDYSSVKIIVQKFLRKSIEDHLNFDLLLYLLEEVELIGDFFINILDFIKHIKDKHISILFFSKFISIVKKSELIKENSKELENILNNFLIQIDEIEKNESFFYRFLISNKGEFKSGIPEEFKEIAFYMNILIIIDGIGQFDEHFMIIKMLISKILRAIDNLELRNSDLIELNIKSLREMSNPELKIILGLEAAFYKPSMELDDRLLNMILLDGTISLKSKIIELINTGNIFLDHLINNIKFFNKEERNKIFIKQEDIIKEYFKDKCAFENLSDHDILNLFNGDISKQLIMRLRENTERYLASQDWKHRHGIEDILASLMIFLSDQNILDYFFSKGLSLLNYVGFDYYYLDGDDNIYVDELNAENVPNNFSLLLVRCLKEKSDTVQYRAETIIKKLRERADYAFHFHKKMEYKDQIIKAFYCIYYLYTNT